jgi:hypothetical protein
MVNTLADFPPDRFGVFAHRLKSVRDLSFATHSAKGSCMRKAVRTPREIGTPRLRKSMGPQFSFSNLDWSMDTQDYFDKKK